MRRWVLKVPGQWGVRMLEYEYILSGSAVANDHIDRFIQEFLGAVYLGPGAKSGYGLLKET